MTSIKKARKASRFINLHGLRHVPHKPTVYHRKLKITAPPPTTNQTEKRLYSGLFSKLRKLFKKA